MILNTKLFWFIPYEQACCMKPFFYSERVSASFSLNWYYLSTKRLIMIISLCPILENKLQTYTMSHCLCTFITFFSKNTYYCYKYVPTISWCQVVGWVSENIKNTYTVLESNYQCQVIVNVTNLQTVLDTKMEVLIITKYITQHTVTNYLSHI